MKTYQPKSKDIKREWHLFDAKDYILGRMASDIARLLMGKHKAGYSRHMDMGDYVVVVNAGKVNLTGNKETKKVYRSHSGYPGGFKEVKLAKLRKEQPEKIISFAVAGMLPDNRLKRDRLKRLKVFADESYKYEKMIKKEITN